MRKLRNLLTLLVVSICVVQSAWADENPVDELTISVTLLEPGSLGSEILSNPNVSHIKDVVNLTVSGPMNDDDWSTIKLIESLKTLNLSAAQVSGVPANQFKNIKNLISILLPESVTSIGSSAFEGCSNLETFNFPSHVAEISSRCFKGCEKLSFTIPEGVSRIENYAFDGCNSFISTIPSTIKYIGSSAFNGNHCMEDIDVVIPQGCELGSSYYDNNYTWDYTNGPFEGSRIRSISFPVEYVNPNDQGCSFSNLSEMTFKSPTVFNYWSFRHGYNSNMDVSNITLHVPAHLVNSYKLHEKWGQCKDVIALSTEELADVTEWPIQTTFNMMGSIRMAGTPNVKLTEDAVLSISGDAAQTFGDFKYTARGFESDREAYEGTMLISTCDNVSITGDIFYCYQTMRQHWHFLSLPFDFKVGDITTENDTKFAIRYYDGASRAQNNSSTDNWKNLDKETVVTAGQGFILQTSQQTTVTFKAQQNNARNLVLSNQIIEVPLQSNDTSEPEHKGWNLVGNPWQTYYNIHKLNYTAPISVYENGTYNVYSVIDDDYALQPNKAFFVQCPNAVSSIGFPIDGRQLTSDISDQQGARGLIEQAKFTRWLVDVQIANGNEIDKTRLVVNNKAKMDYEIGSDANKFMSTEGTVPQIYSLDAEGTEYAINERPLDKGTLRLGIMIKEEGQYTISAIRNDIGQVLLKDQETSITTDLSQHGYSFSATAGTDESRFILSFNSDEVTGISEMKTKADDENESFFNLRGQHVNQPTKGVYVAGGKKVILK